MAPLPQLSLLLFILPFSSASDLLDGITNPRAYPMVVSTWPFLEAVRAAWRSADGGSSAVDAVVEGCSACEVLRCDGTDNNGGRGCRCYMRYVKDGIKAAKLVMEHTEHTLLVGEQASVFAISMGLSGPTNLSSPESIEKWIKWKEASCQPNFRKNVHPANSCGPYHASHAASTVPENFCKVSKNVNGGQELPRGDLLGTVKSNYNVINYNNHDTIAMAVIDRMGQLAVGTSTNGATFKIPGRVGDGPIAGSSAYADDEVGACGATGDGDIMMRFLPCYQVVESMRLGKEPKVAAADAISRIARKYPDFVGAVFALHKNGKHAGACHGWTFQYSVRSPYTNDVEVFTVVP